jgi:Trk K+ transport system NAD-binding subunit
VAIPCGVRVAVRSGKVVLNPEKDYVLAAGDEVLAITASRSTACRT